MNFRYLTSELSLRHCNFVMIWDHYFLPTLSIYQFSSVPSPIYTFAPSLKCMNIWPWVNIVPNDVLEIQTASFQRILGKSFKSLIFNCHPHYSLSKNIFSTCGKSLWLICEYIEHIFLLIWFKRVLQSCLVYLYFRWPIFYIIYFKSYSPISPHFS